jgi:hypothetical protein
LFISEFLEGSFHARINFESEKGLHNF